MFRGEGSCSEHFHDNEKCEVNVFSQSSVEEFSGLLFYFLFKKKKMTKDVMCHHFGVLLLQIK